MEPTNNDRQNPKALHSHGHLRNHYNLTYLNTYSKEDILHMLKKYFLLMVVRHPLDRLISGYRDKLAGNNTVFEKGLGKRVLRRFRPQASQDVIKQGWDVTFREFIQYITTSRTLDSHFAGYQSQCFPCLIQYNYIAKLETQHVDAPYIINNYLSGYGADDTSNLHSNRGGASRWKALPEYDGLSVDELDTLATMYTLDMHMFGYHVQKYNGTMYGSCGIDLSQEDCC